MNPANGHATDAATNPTNGRGGDSATCARAQHAATVVFGEGNQRIGSGTRSTL